MPQPQDRAENKVALADLRRRAQALAIERYTEGLIDAEELEGRIEAILDAGASTAIVTAITDLLSTADLWALPVDALPAVLADLMRDIGIPNGLGAVGYGEADIDDLVAGTMKQQRLLDTAPLPVDEDAAAGILTRSLQVW